MRELQAERDAVEAGFAPVVSAAEPGAPISARLSGQSGR